VRANNQLILENGTLPQDESLVVLFKNIAQHIDLIVHQILKGGSTSGKVRALLCGKGLVMEEGGVLEQSGVSCGELSCYGT